MLISKTRNDFNKFLNLNKRFFLIKRIFLLKKLNRKRMKGFNSLTASINRLTMRILIMKILLMLMLPKNKKLIKSISLKKVMNCWERTRKRKRKKKLKRKNLRKNQSQNQESLLKISNYCIPKKMIKNSIIKFWKLIKRS